MFLFKLVVFSLCLIVIDRILGFCLQSLYFDQRVGQFSQTTYAVDSSKQDLLIFGSSRAVRHYSSPILSKGCGLSCYNSGRDGQMIPYSIALEEVSLNRHKPKLIILDINPWEFAVNQSKYEKLTILLPYCDKHKELIKYIKEISAFEPYKLLSKVYPYNSSIFIMANNTLFRNSEKKDDNGYLPLEGKMTKAELQDYQLKMNQRSINLHKKKNLVDYKAIKYFKEFLDNTIKNRIKTLVIISPTILKNSVELDNQSLQKSIIIDICKHYNNITFLDYSTDARFNYHPEKFSDEFHLNTQGSKEFSTILTKYIKDNL